MSRYLVTDPCYVIENDDWDKFLNETNFGESVHNYKVEGVGTIVECDSSYGGDGSWKLAPGKEVHTDAGLVCIVELEEDYEPTAYNGNAVTDSRGTAQDWFEHVHSGYDEDEEEEDRGW